MPAAKKIAKPKTMKATKTKPRTVKTKTEAKAKKMTAASKAPAKHVKSLSDRSKTASALRERPKTNSTTNISIFRKLLEERKREQERRSSDGHSHSYNEGRDKYHNQKHVNFGRFAGPRRKAA